MSETKHVSLMKVVRKGVSPMNPRVRYAELECGHDMYVSPEAR